VTTTYTLSAYSEAGGQSRSLTVIVSSAPTPPPPTPPPPTPPPPQVICTPGALKCIGPDLYVCNSSGSAWTLKTKNSPTCAAGGSTPDFWTDPVGWVIGTITKAWEAMLGFVSGQFNIFLNNLKSFQDTFMAQLAVFIADPLKSLRSWLDDVYASVSSIAGEVSKAIGSWWDDQVRILQRGWDNTVNGVKSWANDQMGILERGWNSTFATVPSLINNAIKGLSAWIDSGYKNIGEWWKSTSKGLTDALGSVWDDFSGYIGEQWTNLGDWWDDQVKILQRGWENVTNGLRTWFDDQIGILSRGWDSTFATIPGLINEATLGIKEFIFDTVPGIVEGVIMDLIKSIPGLQTVIDFIGGLYDTITGKYPKDPVITEIQEKQKTAKQQLEELFLRK
jgi:hypothetical protein